jgi:phosphoribosylformylglycinamidine cyclo-ligase
MSGKQKSEVAMTGLSYKDAGVDIEAGNQLIDRIKPASQRTHRTGVMGGLGGFGGLFDLKQTGYTDPVLVSATDGVGTKLRLAIEAQKFDTIGQDLVAMCVNDLLCQGAEPLFFLDYFATGKLELDQASTVINGIAKACELSGCALIGGETAEMPGMYHEGDFDLAGFAVGAVERSDILPRKDDIKTGDLIIGVASSGAHSNGYSLIRKIIAQMDLHDAAPFASGQTLGEALLTPTQLYIKPVLPLLKRIKALAHITGGGLLENIVRVLPNVQAVIQGGSWTVPPLFQWLSEQGGVAEREMLRTFNCGIGLCIVVDKQDSDYIIQQLGQSGLQSFVIGHIQGDSAAPEIAFDGSVFS